MRVTPSRTRDQGFTMIEVLVALVLSAIVLSLILGAVTDIFGASERSSTKARTQKAAVDAVELLTADLRAARAPEREPSFTGSPDNLRVLVLEQTNPRGILVHDITAATSSSVTFYAELFGSSVNSECVTWQVTPTSALHRTVRGFTRGCVGGGGAVLQDTEVMPASERARAAAGAAMPTPFTYGMLRQANPAAADPDPDQCSTPVVAAPAGQLGRDQVVSINLTLRSFLAAKTGRGEQELRSTVSIPSRQGLDYRYAIGCAA